VLSRVLEEFPAKENGLSQTEQQLLRAVGEGNSVVKIVAQTMGTSEECLGDWELFDRIWNFVSAAVSGAGIASRRGQCRTNAGTLRKISCPPDGFWQTAVEQHVGLC
jgi:hypothetical protein